MVPFNKAQAVGTVNLYRKSTEETNCCGKGECKQKCEGWIEDLMGNGSKAFLTASCISSLELAAILIDIKPADEVILPSFTFVSSVNAFVLRCATLI